MKSAALHRWLALTLLSALLSSCSQENGDKPRRRGEDAVTVTVARVEVLPLNRTIPGIVGKLLPKDEATLGAEVEGRVETTLVEFGERVKAGQLLAHIDTTTYDALARQAAANTARAQANAVNAELSLKRIEELRKASISSVSDLDAAIAEAQQARAAVKAVEAAEVLAQINRERSHVKAPFAAAVAERIASAGDFMKVGSPLFRVVNDGTLRFIFQVPEAYASQVKHDQPAVFSVDAYPGQTFEGKVYLISPQVNPTTLAFNVGALVENSERKLKANSYARGELILSRDVATTVVPLDAVIVFAGVTKVFVVENDIARSRQVQVGRITNGRQEILGGVKAGDSVVVNGMTKLFDGARVKVNAP